MDCPNTAIPNVPPSPNPPSAHPPLCPNSDRTHTMSSTRPKSPKMTRNGRLSPPICLQHLPPLLMIWAIVQPRTDNRPERACLLQGRGKGSLRNATQPTSARGTTDEPKRPIMTNTPLHNEGRYIRHVTMPQEQKNNIDEPSLRRAALTIASAVAHPLMSTRHSCRHDHRGRSGAAADARQPRSRSETRNHLTSRDRHPPIAL